MKTHLSSFLLASTILLVSVSLCISSECPVDNTSPVHVNIVEDNGLDDETGSRELILDFNEQYNDGRPTSFIGHIFQENELVFNNFFEWGDDMGTLYKKGWIDREQIAMQLFDTYNPVQFEFDILFYTELVALTRCLNVTFHVVDLDDHTPSFSSSMQHIVFEDDNTETGKERSLLHPGDHDEGNNGTTIYELVDPSGKFSLAFRNYPCTTRPFSLILVNDLPLDHEEQPSYQLQLQAREANENPDEAVLNITVEVVDVCDEPSMFSTSRYMPSIRENATLNTPVITVEATDADDPEVCPLQYTITRFCGRETLEDNCIAIPLSTQLFTLDSESGILTLTGVLDRESIEEYEVTVQAADSQQSSATAVVIITIDDTNDNFPTVQGIILGSIPEFQVVDPNFAIGHITVLDPDAGPNGELTLQLLDNSTGVPLASETFTAVTENFIDYQIILSHSLDHEAQNEFNLIIEVRDNGSPPLYTYQPVTIRILDNNDHPPMSGAIQTMTIPHRKEWIVIVAYIVIVTSN